MPYIGYFQLMKVADKYVVYDDVNFINKGWINRNNILINRQKKMFTISLSGASQNKLINEIDITDNFIKLQKAIEINYRKAPYFNEVFALLTRIFAYPDRNLARFIFHSFRVLNEYLDIETDLILSSCIDKDSNLKGQDKILAICKALNANIYINAIGGQNLYNRDKFEQNDIELKFLQTEKTQYRQFDNDFIPDLSMIDVLMFNSPEGINKMLDQFTLI